MESSGLSYTIGDGKYVGYHIDVCEKIVSDVRKALGLSGITTKYQPVTSANRIPLTVNGTVDLECGSTTNNATRQKDVAFAVTTYVEEVRAVKANSGINSIKDLANKTVATTTGTTSVQTLRKHERSTVWTSGGLREGPRGQLPAAGIWPRRRLCDGRLHPGQNIATSKNPGTTRSLAKCCPSSRSPS